MQSEYLDKKVREAAEKHHPAYDEKAWQKMEILLDRHLPVKKDDDRRRVFFMLFLFLLIGGGAFVLISKPWNKNGDGAVATSQPKVSNEIQPITGDRATIQSQPHNSNAVEPDQSTPSSRGSQISISGDKNITEVTARANVPPVSTRPQTAERGVTNDQDENNAPSVGKKQLNQEQPPITERLSKEGVISDKKDANKTPDLTASGDTKAVDNPVQQTTASQNADAQAAIPQATQPGAAPIHKEKSSRRSGFAFSVSMGPDVSKTPNSGFGKLTLAYGAGISYTKSRFTLRTGVYGARKIYDAGAEDYKLPYQPPTNVKFEGAEANCYVVEIPVQLFYNFAFKNKSSWYAGAGLSSYLMKSEKYSYQLKTITGGSYYKKWDVKNQNKHYFSILDLSAGYNVRLSNTLSLSAEPYLKIPLSGIGVGKVQLNSGGVLFTLGIQPFRK